MKSSASSRLEGRTGKRESVTKRNVKRTTGPSPLTPTQRREVARLAAASDRQIDYSDIPQLTPNFWKNAVRNPFYRPVKRQVTVRLDADVIAWLRQPGKGYQSRLNRLLRAAMLEDVVNGNPHSGG
jgi:uncharacterized protein (DUF4415 family)